MTKFRGFNANSTVFALFRCNNTQPGNKYSIICSRVPSTIHTPFRIVKICAPTNDIWRHEIDNFEHSKWFECVALSLSLSLLAHWIRDWRYVPHFEYGMFRMHCFRHECDDFKHSINHLNSLKHIFMHILADNLVYSPFSFSHMVLTSDVCAYSTWTLRFDLSSCSSFQSDEKAFVLSVNRLMWLMSRVSRTHCSCHKHFKCAFVCVCMLVSLFTCRRRQLN